MNVVACFRARFARAGVRRLLVHLGLFIVPASALWALLPLVATRQLGLGAGGYGLLLGALRAGAIAGAFTLPWLRARPSNNRVLPAASVVYGAAMFATIMVHHRGAAFLALIPAGAAWITVIAGTTTAFQLFLPGWVRARGLAANQMVLFGTCSWPMRPAPADYRASTETRVRPSRSPGPASAAGRRA